MSVRRFDGAVCDHGAQFFTAHDDGFARQVGALCETGVLATWSKGFPTVTTDAPPGKDVCFRGASGMNALPKHLAAGLDIRTGALVTRITRTSDTWRVDIAGRETMHGRSLLITIPGPQAVELIDRSVTDLDAAVHSELAKITYDPCIAVMATVAGDSRIPTPGGLHVNGRAIRWLADNKRKGISPQRTAITLHATADFSRAQVDGDLAAAADALLAEATPWLGGPVVERQVHRWRYSYCTRTADGDCLVVDSPRPIAFAGDGFGGPRVESAALSGLAAARRLVPVLQGLSPSMVRNEPR